MVWFGLLFGKNLESVNAMTNVYAKRLMCSAILNMLTRIQTTTNGTYTYTYDHGYYGKKHKYEYFKVHVPISRVYKYLTNYARKFIKGEDLPEALVNWEFESFMLHVLKVELDRTCNFMDEMSSDEWIDDEEISNLLRLVGSWVDQEEVEYDEKLYESRQDLCGLITKIEGKYGDDLLSLYDDITEAIKDIMFDDEDYAFKETLDYEAPSSMCESLHINPSYYKNEEDVNNFHEMDIYRNLLINLLCENMVKRS